jgi:DNA-binding XRE family transcriptional regulator
MNSMDLSSRIVNCFWEIGLASFVPACLQDVTIRGKTMGMKAHQASPNHLLRLARKQRGWTQREVADRIGAPLALNVTRWERGTTFPSAYYARQTVLARDG